jgi:hypothetical protein
MAVMLLVWLTIFGPIWIGGSGCGHQGEGVHHEPAGEYSQSVRLQSGDIHEVRMQSRHRPRMIHQPCIHIIRLASYHIMSLQGWAHRRYLIAGHT